MTPVFDSNVIIDYLNGFDQAEEELATYATLLISAITWIEVLAGARGKIEEDTARNVLRRFILIETDAKIREMAVILRQQKRLRLPDAIILATAKVRNTLLVTRNTKDFDTSDPSIRVPYTL